MGYSQNQRCVHAEFYVSQSKHLSSVQFLEYLASHTHTGRGVTIWCIGTTEQVQYGPHRQVENKIFLAPCQSILNMFLYTFSCNFFGNKKGGGGGGERTILQGLQGVPVTRCFILIIYYICVDESLCMSSSCQTTTPNET